MVNDRGPNTPRNDESREDVDAEDFPEEEFHIINQQLDQINAVLDHLEKKNADIHAQLVEILHTSKKTREECKQALEFQPEEMDQTESSSRQDN